jgi:hypothetical protein
VRRIMRGWGILVGAAFRQKTMRRTYPEAQSLYQALNGCAATPGTYLAVELAPYWRLLAEYLVLHAPRQNVLGRTDIGNAIPRLEAATPSLQNPLQIVSGESPGIVDL